MKKQLICIMMTFCILLSLFSVCAEKTVAPTVGTEALSTEAIDYADVSNWAFWKDGDDKPADLFIVCPTVDMGKNGNYIADAFDESYRESFRGALNMELGIYKDVATVYAPYYRQASFTSYSLAATEQERYLQYAYQDVKAAFLHYAKQADASRPLILAGFSQGSDMVLRLMKDLFDEAKYARRLVAAYCIGWRITEEDVKAFPHIIPASHETDTGVVIAFNTEAENVQESLIVGKDEKTYAINPLNWRTDAQRADKSQNLGACFTDYDANITKEVPELTGAYLDEKRGTLKVTDISEEAYPAKLFDAGIYHLYDYQFFFRNLQKNVSTRLNAYTESIGDTITVAYNGRNILFDVPPIIENGRTLVPVRAIFEAMGCVVSYAVADDNKQYVYAHRGDDTLMLCIGSNEMQFNGETVLLDVPAIVKDSRTLLPLRAISEAFFCEVFWEQDTKTVIIEAENGYFDIEPHCLTETVLAEDKTVLIEAVAYYPVIENETNNPFIDEINEEYYLNAQAFLKDAVSQKEEAQLIYHQMGKDEFAPYSFSLTYEAAYNTCSIISVKNHMYMNVGGAHPTTLEEARSYDFDNKTELSLSQIIDEKAMKESLSEYVYNLFAKVLNDAGMSPEENGEYTALKEEIGSVQYYLTQDSLVMYFNQGQIAPYALGRLSVEMPYDKELFLIDMCSACLEKQPHFSENK